MTPVSKHPRRPLSLVEIHAQKLAPAQVHAIWARILEGPRAPLYPLARGAFPRQAVASPWWLCCEEEMS